ncbi:MAG: LamG domain-containing protein [Lentisphaeria bacterium]|nr:LamG domain-containing protein [Lentisphaeria bacterium]
MKKLILSAMIVCSALASFAADPVVEFKLNEGSGKVVKDSAGTVKGEVCFPENTKWIDGRDEGSKALYFTGVPDKTRKGGCVRLYTGKTVDFTKPFTVMYYFYLDKKLPRASTKEMVSCSKGENGAGFRTLFSWNRICFWTGNGKKRTELNTNPSKVKVARGVWQHLAITFDNGKAVIYFNGTKVAERDKMMPVTEFPAVMDIASYKRGYAYNFNGAISDVKVFNTALTDKEILAMVKGIE